MIEKILEPLVPERFKSDSKYRNGHISVIHPLPGERILGVHIPELKSLAKRLVESGEAQSLIERFAQKQASSPVNGLLYEEKQLWGMIINRMHLSLAKRLDYIRVFLPAINNWAVCDTFCADAKWAKKTQVETWCFIQEFFYSKKEFEVRFAIVMCLAHFIHSDYIDKIYHMIEKIRYQQISSDYIDMSVKPYYVYMAAAWLMATALYKLPEQTREFASSGRCPETVLKLYVRKARESIRTRNISTF